MRLQARAAWPGSFRGGTASSSRNFIKICKSWKYPRLTAALEAGMEQLKPPRQAPRRLEGCPDSLSVHVLPCPLLAAFAHRGTLSLGSCSAVRWKTAASAAAAVRPCAPHPPCSSRSLTLRVAAAVHPAAGWGCSTRCPETSRGRVWGAHGGAGRAWSEASSLPSDKTGKNCDFAQVLKRSICLEQNTQAWCDNCEKYQPTVSGRLPWARVLPRGRLGCGLTRDG